MASAWGAAFGYSWGNSWGLIETAEEATGIIGPDTYALQKHLRNIDARDLIDIMGLVLISGILDE